MSNRPKIPRKAIRPPRTAQWADDPEQSLSKVEFERVLTYFGKTIETCSPKFEISLRTNFQTFVADVESERFREKNGRLVSVEKPSTIVEKEMKKLNKACIELESQLANLDPATKNWIDELLREKGFTRENNAPQRLRHLDDQISRPVELLIGLARYAEGLASPGPDNTVIKEKINFLANCWEICHGNPPSTDKGRGQRDDPFLALCQEIAQITDAKLKAKGGRLGTLNWSGLVSDVLKQRRSQHL